MPRLIPGILLVTLLSVAPAWAAPLDLSEVLPGDVHLGALLDVDAIRRDLPATVAGLLLDRPAEALLELGLPDPRGLVGAAALGLDLEERRPVEGVLLGAGALRLEAPARGLAARLGVPLVEVPYRGVTFLQLELPQGPPLAVADLGESMVYLSSRRGGSHLRPRDTVDTWLGSHRSFRERHGMGLEPGTYLVAAARWPLSTRAVWRRDPELAGLSYALQGSLALRRTGGVARLALAAEAGSSLEARLVELAMRKGLERLKREVTDPDLRALLDRVVIERQGKQVLVFLDLPLGAGR